MYLAITDDLFDKLVSNDSFGCSDRRQHSLIWHLIYFREGHSRPFSSSLEKSILEFVMFLPFIFFLNNFLLAGMSFNLANWNSCKTVIWLRAISLLQHRHLGHLNLVRRKCFQIEFRLSSLFFCFMFILAFL